jgi:predicted P-loop ATPase
VLAYHAMRETVWTLRPPPWDSNVTPAGGAKPGEWTAADTTRLTGWLAKEWDLDVKDGMIDAQVNVQALRNVLDPVRDYFESLPPWDEVPRLDTFIARHLGAPDTTYVRAVTARWMISIVARTYEPGAKVDCMPVFIGKQGRGKSTLLRRLCADEDWYADLDIEGNKDDAQNLRGKLIVELGEMSGMSRAEVTKLKRFVSLKIDTYRPSYERRARDFKRRCVFGGSSNEETPLRDTTGDRRYWPIDVSPNINPADVDRGITAERDQLFAEALHRYRKGETWWVDSTELEEMTRVEQEAHRKTHPWEEKVGPFLAAKLLETCNGTSKCTCAKHGVMPGEALAAIGIDTAAQDATKADIMRGILRVFGWRCTRDTPQRRGHAPWSPTGRDRPFFPPEARDGAPEPPKGPALPPTTDNPKADHQAATAHAAAMEAAFERGEATQEVVDAARMHAGEMHKRWVAELANCG